MTDTNPTTKPDAAWQSLFAEEAALPQSAARLAGDDLVLISTGRGGVPANGDSTGVELDDAGHFMAFASLATNLILGDTNARYDVFVTDLETGRIERVSLSSAGVQGKSHSTDPDISGNGRYVTYESTAANLVAGDTNRASDVFLFDRDTDLVKRISIGANGVEANAASLNPAISQNGRFVAFESNASNLAKYDRDHDSDIFLWNDAKKAVELASFGIDNHTANRASMDPEISANGRFVVYASYASNLVEGDTNGQRDVFVYDRLKQVIERVSIATDGTQGNGDSENPSISADGRYVSFSSTSSNLVKGDTNGNTDVFVYDRTTDVLQRVSVKADGSQVWRGSGESEISADGRKIAFISYADNLVPDDNNGQRDVFVKDLDTGLVELISRPNDGSLANGMSLVPAISADAGIVAFDSDASNLVEGDVNGKRDIFAIDLHDGSTDLIFG